MIEKAVRVKYWVSPKSCEAATVNLLNPSGRRYVEPNFSSRKNPGSFFPGVSCWSPIVPYTANAVVKGQCSDRSQRNTLTPKLYHAIWCPALRRMCTPWRPIRRAVLLRRTNHLVYRTNHIVHWNQRYSPYATNHIVYRNQPHSLYQNQHL
jgi:hypothetical protein